jgi:undecaprenyl phosphate-alpha-L-ara4FN deformylase
VFKNPGFVSKMRRTRAVSMYGLRTLMSGTLLPARPIALAYPQVLRDLVRMGFEVGVHGYDHVLWQDHLDDLGEDGIRRELEDGFEVYRAIFGTSPRSFAAPGWRTNADALKNIDRLGLDYHSDTRGQSPYRCVVDHVVLSTPEIPTTLPTLDEVMGDQNLDGPEAIVRFYLERFSTDRLNVHTVHAETEGMGHLETFVAIIRGLKERQAQFRQLRDIAADLRYAELPACEVIRTNLPGRAGWISMQRSSGPQAS